jgi:hypothetical protein
MEKNERPSQPIPGDRIEWFTVRYRSLMIGGAVLVIVAAAIGWAFLGRRAPEPAPTPQSVETGAQFLSLEGSVQVKREGTLEWVEATTAVFLRSNDLVRTGADATAEIKFADGTRFGVRPNSLITIEESSHNLVSHRQRVALSIQSGEANFQTAARTIPGETTISTPTVRTTADRETVGNIQVDDATGDTGIRIFQGSGRAETTTGQQIQLSSNEGVQVAANGTAGEKTTLPGVPVLVAPPDNTEVAYPDPSRAITLLTWNGVEGANSYRVAVDYSRTFARPLVDRQGFEGTQMQLRGLETSTYYWRVAAVGEDGVEGSFTPVARFSLLKAPAAAASPPPITVETLELRGNILHVRGRTAPGATLTLDDVRIEVQPDGSFNEFVMFEGGGAATVVLRATAVSGGVAEARRPIVVTD